MIEKVKTVKEIAEISKGLRKEGKTIVVTNGCFDILHSAHVNLLEKAKKEGDVLIIMLNSDASIKKFKSTGRPINGEIDRAKVVSAFAFVDYIVIFNEDDPLDLIKKIMPHKIVKGGTYIPEKVRLHKETLNLWGGKFVHLPMEEGYSSTNIIEKIRKLR